MTEFIGFPKIPRLFRDTIITEKIDGTNAQINVPEDPCEPLVAGSRRRLLTVENDNFGFAAWVAEHEDELRELGPGRHFGEWWGQGIQRNYGLDERRFSLFNVSRWRAASLMVEYPDTESVLGDRIPAPACCYVVPILYICQFVSERVTGVLERLEHVGSAAAPGFMQPEGIVVYHTAANQCFKVTIENDEQPKGQTR